MKRLINMTTNSEDTDRFANRDELDALIGRFDGLELLCYEEDTRGLIPKERVIGLHMCYFPNWLDLWRGDEEALLREFDSLEQVERYYGGTTRDALLARFKADFTFAAQYEVEYLVFHVSQATIEESFAGRYRYTDEEVISATCELINLLLPEDKGFFPEHPSLCAHPPALLFENLWQPGLNLLDPRMTRLLLEGVAYPHTGLMLDTGHALHTNTRLRTENEGIAYIHRLLDKHGDLCERIRGMHLQQSLTGEYTERVLSNPPILADDYDGRSWQMFEHAFATDLHLPFTSPRVRGLVERIAPDYVTFEFITSDNEQHRAYLETQWRALEGDDYL